MQTGLIARGNELGTGPEDGDADAFRLADLRDLAPAVARCRALFDLDADPVAVDVPGSVLWSPASEAAPLTALLADDPTRGGLAPALELFAASGPAEEVREVLRRVLAAGLRWDEVEIVASDPVVYGGALHALGQRLGIPVSFAVGLPVERTRTGRAAAAWFRWIEEGYPAVELRRLLESGDLRPPGWEGSFTRLARRLRLLRIGWGHGRYLPAVRRALDALDGPLRPRRKFAPWLGLLRSRTRRRSSRMSSPSRAP